MSTSSVTLDLVGVSLIISADVHNTTRYHNNDYPMMSIKIVSRIYDFNYGDRSAIMMSYEDIDRLCKFLYKYINNKFDSVGTKKVSIGYMYMQFSTDVDLDDDEYSCYGLHMQINPYVDHGTFKKFSDMIFKIDVTDLDEIKKLYRFFKDILRKYKACLTLKKVKSLK